MQVRLYRAGKKFRGYVDEYTLYFPYPKKIQKTEKISGYGIGCSQTSNGDVIRCSGFDVDCFATTNLGRKVSLETMSPEFQKWARNLERIWNDALKYDDAEHWQVWNLS